MHSLDEDEADVLTQIYVKQHVRGSGVLASDFSSELMRKVVAKLEAYEYILADKFYKYDTIRTTNKGTKLIGNRIQTLFEELSEDIKSELSQIPQRAYRFLVFDCLANTSTWPTNKSNSLFWDWRRFPFEDDRVWRASESLFSALERISGTVPVALKTRNYVSTKGGELRDEEFAFPPEMTAGLEKLATVRQGLDDSESRSFRVAHFFVDVTPYLRPENKVDVREFVWQKLKGLELTEDDIIPRIEDLSRNKVCSEWMGFYTSKAPFTVADPLALMFYLRQGVIRLGVDSLMASKESAQGMPPGAGSQVVVSASASFGGRDSEFKRAAELFGELAILELALRDLIETRLQKQFGRNWISQLPLSIYSNWIRKRDEDLEASIEPENDLLNYADFSDYAEILTSGRFRSLFNDAFGDVENTKVALKEIKIHGRNRVMHLRTITDESYQNANRWIRWIKNQLAKASLEPGS